MSPALTTLQFAQATRPGCLSGRILASIPHKINAKKQVSSAHPSISTKRTFARISKLPNRSFRSCVVGAGDRAKQHRREIPEEPMELEVLGMSFGCVLGALQAWRLPDKDCLLPLVSKVLGYCIVAASTTVKLPQIRRLDWPSYKLEDGSLLHGSDSTLMILKILKHNSVRGLSVVAFELEVAGYTIALSYCIHKGLPFSAYGELFFLLIQAIILVAIIYYYSQPNGAKTWIKLLLYGVLAPTVLTGQIDQYIFEALYASQHAIFFFARVPQMWTNFKNKSTGELSFLTCLMNCVGSTARVFTSIQENAPLSVIMGSALSGVMNGTILSQIALYQIPVAKKAKKAKKEE